MPACRPNLLSLTMSSASLKSRELDQEGDRAERLLDVELGRRIDILEQGRLEHRAVALAAAEQVRALLDRLLDPVVEPLRLLHVDHRADEDVAVLGVAGDQASWSS